MTTCAASFEEKTTSKEMSSNSHSQRLLLRLFGVRHGSIIPRMHLLEIHEQEWCPIQIRHAVQYFLHLAWTLLPIYKAAAMVLEDALEEAGECNIIDLCSGGGGPMPNTLTELRLSVLSKASAKTSARQQETLAKIPTCTLTDLYPFPENWIPLAKYQPGGGLYYEPTSVNAMQLSTRTRDQFSNRNDKYINKTSLCKGFRTLFMSFHHFKPNQAQGILQDAVDSNTGIAIFELTNRSPLYVVILPLLLALVVLPAIVLTSLNIVWLVLGPLIVFVTVFDGAVSCLRSYTEEEMHQMIGKLENTDNFRWQVRTVFPRFQFPLFGLVEYLPVPVFTLVGIPKK